VVAAAALVVLKAAVLDSLLRLAVDGAVETDLVRWRHTSA
jgi:hypothetical protein